MIRLEPGDILIEKNGSFAVLLERTDSLGVGSWRVFWNDGKKDIFPWVETSIKGDITEGNIKLVQARKRGAYHK